MGRRVAAVGAVASLGGVALTARAAGRSRGRLSGFRSPDGERRYQEAYQKVLTRWPTPYRELTAPTPFGDTHVLASGDLEAPPLVLLHATGTSSTGWLLNVAPLSEHHRVLAVDIIGEAGRSKQTRLLRNREDCVRWLASVLDELRLQRTSLAGWSFGGWTTLAFTIDAPDRVTRSVLLAPFGSLARYAVPVLLFLRIGPYLPVGPPGSLALRMMSPGYHFDADFARQFVLGGRQFVSADPRASVFPTPFTSVELQSIRTPVLLLVGDRESTFDPRDAMAQAKRHISGVRTRLVQGSGHMVAMEASTLANDEILDFLSH
jgi:pimeloyl-ACP methyl ester carboxylesterase